MEPDWPSSLEGYAKKAYEFYMAELKPLGYKLAGSRLSWRHAWRSRLLLELGSLAGA